MFIFLTQNEIMHQETIDSNNNRNDRVDIFFKITNRTTIRRSGPKPIAQTNKKHNKNNYCWTKNYQQNNSTENHEKK